MADDTGLASGFGAAGAASGLQELIANRLLRDKMAAAEAAQQAQEEHAQDQFDQQKQQQAFTQNYMTEQARQARSKSFEDAIRERNQSAADLELRKQGLAQAAQTAETTAQQGEERIGLGQQAQTETERQNRAQNAIEWARVHAEEAKGSDKADDAGAIADAIQRGDAPPDLSRLYGMAGPVRAKLARAGYNLTQATEDWTATQKFLATANGNQQTRLRQAIETLPPMLDKIDALAGQWKSNGWGPLSRASLTAAKNGAYGQAQQSVAVALDAQIADATADLGNVYMGGNSPTDHSLALAAKNLQGDWAEKTLHDMVQQARENVAYRKNSIRTVGPTGTSANNPYAPGAAGPTTQPSGGGGGGGKIMRFDAQGNLIP